MNAKQRRKDRYKFALVEWIEQEEWGYPQSYAVEPKNTLNMWRPSEYTILCDDQPEKVLRGMLKLLKEEK
jgi:hypothetical protein